MSDQENSPLRKLVPLHEIKMESGSEELLSSSAMEPYMNLALALMGGRNIDPAIERISALQLEERYVWRVVSALKWAFADFETLNVEVDRQTLASEDLQRLADECTHRSLQFCLFLGGLIGQERMELTMASAIRTARVVAEQSPGFETL
jgi:hypothetical protein